MSDFLLVVLLAMIQGLTEFLPISSSAHLLLPSLLFGAKDFGIVFDISVHAGTLAAVIYYFKKDRIAYDFFNLQQTILADWKEYYRKFAPKRTQKWPSMDVTSAMALKIMGIEDQTTDKKDDTILENCLFGKKFSNPFGLAAGFDKNGELPEAVSRLGFGFTEIGTVTPQPQEGKQKINGRIILYSRINAPDGACLLSYLQEKYVYDRSGVKARLYLQVEGPMVHKNVETRHLRARLPILMPRSSWLPESAPAPARLDQRNILQLSPQLLPAVRNG